MAVGTPYTAEMFRSVHSAPAVMFSLYSAGYIFAAICTMLHRTPFRLAMGVRLCDRSPPSWFSHCAVYLNRSTFKHAQAEIERLVQDRRQATPSRAHLVYSRAPRTDLDRLAALCAQCVRLLGYYRVSRYLHGAPLTVTPVRCDLLCDDFLRRAILSLLCRHRVI